VLLDAIASSVGQRVVMSRLGTLKTQRPETARGLVDANLELPATLAAGGNYSQMLGDVPAKLTIACPKYAHYVPWCDGARYPYVREAPAENSPLAGTNRAIHTTAYADFTGGSVAPDNNALLEDLATQIADDYYSWLERRYDLTFNGIVLWEPNGCDNYVEWSLGSQRPDGSYTAYTRVQSQPVDLGVDSNLCQDPSKVVLDKFQLGRITTPTGQNPFALAQVYDHIAGAEAPKDDPPITLKVWPWPKGSALRDDTWVWLFWHCEKNAWYAVPKSTGELIRFRLKADKAFNVAAAAVRLDYDKNEVGPLITVIDTVGDWSGAADICEGWAVHLDDNPNPDEYEIIFMDGAARWIEVSLTDYYADALGFAFSGAGASRKARGTLLRAGEAYWGLTDNGIVEGEPNADIYDEMRMFPRALPGSRCLAVLDERVPDAEFPVRGRYRAVICDQMSLLNKCELYEAMCSADGTGTVTAGTVETMMCAPFGMPPDVVLLNAFANLIYNPYGSAGKAGDFALFAWNEDLELFEVLTVQHFEYTVLLAPDTPPGATGCQVPSIQKLKTPLMRCEDPTGAGLFDFEEKDIIVSFETVSTDCATGSGSGSGSGVVTPGSCSLVAKTEKICVLKRNAPEGEEQGEIAVATMTPVEVEASTTFSVELGCEVSLTRFLYVLCWCEGNLVENWCGDPCASGSGSGSE
jgi:hypothetical protein